MSETWEQRKARLEPGRAKGMLTVDSDDLRAALARLEEAESAIRPLVEALKAADPGDGDDWLRAHTVNDHMVTLDHKDEMSLCQFVLDVRAALAADEERSKAETQPQAEAQLAEARNEIRALTEAVEAVRGMLWRENSPFSRRIREVLREVISPPQPQAEAPLPLIEHPYRQSPRMEGCYGCGHPESAHKSW